MTEPTNEDYKLRFLLLNEWKSKSSINEATKNIRSKLSENSNITFTKVKYWFKRFDKGDTSLFEKDSKLNLFVQNSSNQAFNSLLFLSDGEYDNFKFIKCDSRLIEYSYEFEGKSFIAQHDLFLNEKRVVELPFYNWNLKIIDGVFLLAFNTENTIDLFKLDFENSTLNSLDTIDLNDDDVRFIYVDQLDPLKFAVFIDGENFSMGKIENEKIVLGDFKNHGRIQFYYTGCLMGSKYHGFYHEHRLNLLLFCEADLNSMETKNLTLSINLDDELLRITCYRPYPYSWSKNQFYGVFWMSDEQQHVLMLDLEMMKWTSVQIVANELRDIFVDSNEVLTLCVGEDKEVNAFYRIALRKPDKLKNLAYLAALRQGTLYANDKYLNCVKNLFITD